MAVTGPTGEVGRSLLAALEGSDRVKRVLGMARRPFDPAEFGWEKVEYRRGDVLDRSTVDDQPNLHRRQAHQDPLFAVAHLVAPKRHQSPRACTLQPLEGQLTDTGLVIRCCFSLARWARRFR